MNNKIKEVGLNLEINEEKLRRLKPNMVIKAIKVENEQLH